MIYLIQVNVYTALMLLVYFLLLRNRTAYNVSRTYLLLGAILPFTIPFIELPAAVQQRIQTPPLQFSMPEVKIAGGVTGSMNIYFIAWAVYGLVAFAMLAYHLWNLYSLQKIVRANGREVRDGYILVANSGYGPGSFGRYIFFPETEVNEAILAHENAHITLHHTRDILFLNLLQVIAWPSLLLGRIKKELKEVHEFQADAMANEDSRSYAELLLSSVLNTRSLPEMHLFIIHPLKRRIMMLQKNGTGSPLKTVLLVSCTTLALIGSLLFAQSCNKNAPKNATVSATEITKDQYDKEAKAMVENPDEMPTPTFDLTDYMVKNVHYPEDAQRQKIEGKVVVQFVVDENGSVKDATVVKSPNEELSKEALRVVTGMAKWTPGKKDGKNVPVSLTLPIAFKLD